jgi:hypothetical protein
MPVRADAIRGTEAEVRLSEAACGGLKPRGNA